MLFFHLAVIGLIFTPRLFVVYSPRNTRFSWTRNSTVGQKLEKLEINTVLSQDFSVLLADKSSSKTNLNWCLIPVDFVWQTYKLNACLSIMCQRNSKTQMYIWCVLKGKYKGLLFCGGESTFKSSGEKGSIIYISGGVCCSIHSYWM